MNTMHNLEILKAGLMTSIQDLGRKGYAYYALPRSGVMDENAARIALLLLHKREDSPLIECTYSAPHIRFHAPTTLAITGADFDWHLNDTPILRHTLIEVKSGDILKGNMSKDGLRGYIAIKAHLILEKHYNSFATYPPAKLGGNQGQLLKKGDFIEWERANTTDSTLPLIPIKPGPEYESLTPEAKDLLISAQFTISTDSNRMGARLQGPVLEHSLKHLEHSVPVLPGFIQLPPGGQPIVVLHDGQVSGGYPRIAYLSRVALSMFVQIPFGTEFGFRMEG